jgi:plasmid stability protein
MATLTIRNVPDETHQALRMRAARNGRSVEEEVRRILAEQASTEIFRNPKSPEEIAAAVKQLQDHFAPMRKTYSVDRFLAEKHAEAAAEFSEAKSEFEK